jgi:hypothetical protein
MSAPASAFAADTYVGGTGASDGNGCTSPSTPCAGIQAGIDQAG